MGNKLDASSGNAIIRLGFDKNKERDKKIERYVKRKRKREKKCEEKNMAKEKRWRKGGKGE